MIKDIPKKPLPTLLSTIGIPFAVVFSIYSFLQIGFNLEDFRKNLQNRYIVTDPLFNPKWSWAIENASAASVSYTHLTLPTIYSV